MYRIAIVEDESEYQEMFKEYINRFANEKGEILSVDIFADGLEITEDYSARWDAILLDIRMKNQDGMSAARVIREHDKNVAIMFITTLAQYAIYGYEVGALDYVLKPVEYDKFAIRFERLINSVRKENKEYIVLPSEDGKDRVDISKIKYIEVEHHDLFIHVDVIGEDKQYVIRKSISVMEKELDGKGFVRCDNSSIVNLSYVTKVKKDVVEVGNIPISISRARKKKFMEAIAQYNI